MDKQERQEMRAKVAEENGFALYRQYGEEQVAAFLKVNISTLKRRRRKGSIPFVKMGDRSIKYMGYMIADMLMGGIGDDDGGPTDDGNAILDALAGKLNGPVREA